jgi:outer membrane protein OmpA-like peptidoglycan-associated protein
MTAHTYREGFLVRGENAPGWLSWGLTLAGLVGSIVTVRLLLPNWSDGYDLAPQHSETTMSTTSVAPPVAKAELGETLDASGLADEPEATLDKDNDRRPAAAETGFDAGRIPATRGTPDTSASDTGVHGPEPVNSSATGGSDARSVSMQQPSSEQVPIQQIGPGGIPEPDEDALVSGATNETPAVIESAPGTPIQADAAKSSFQSTPADVQGDATSEQMVDEVGGDCAPLFSVGFKHGGVVPKGENMNEKIERLSAWLSAHPSAIVYVDGHADSSGPEEVNLVISFQRAAAVAALLKDAGASKAKLVVRAFGESKSPSPSIRSDSERRVDLSIDTSMRCDRQAPTGGGLR